MRICTIAVLGALMSGCATLGEKVVFGDVSRDSAAYVVDATGPDDYPSSMAAEANIYSCRYGIHHQSSGQFDPPKAVVFGSILGHEIPGITTRLVVLERFDVYHNYRLRLLNVAGTGMGGAVGAAIASVGRVNEHVFTFEKLQVDMNPGSSSIPGENMVGCDNGNEGEYYASRISAGHDVVVTWLEFTVDSTALRMRTFYQFQPATKADVAAGIDEAVRMSIRAAASRVAG